MTMNFENPIQWSGKKKNKGNGYEFRKSESKTID